ncbi:MAG: ABC transporter permease [Clostridiaceae bacterium]|nr:ABC transporter permease [Clostridiaceae bacterium]
MLEFLYRKIINNKWLFLCLLIGSLSACGIFSSIPLYSNAILQKVLTKDLEASHLESRRYPGAYSVELVASGRYGKPLVDQVKDIAERQLSTSFHLPVVDTLYSVRLNGLKLKREEDQFFNDQKNVGYPVFLSNYEPHIRLVRGRIPSKETVDGVYEAAITLEAMNRLQLLQDQEYSLEWQDFFSGEGTQIARFKVVGIFTVEDLNSIYWSGGRYNKLGDAILFSDEQISQMIAQDEKVTIKHTEYACFLDYKAVKIDDVDAILETMEEQYRWNENNGNLLKLTLPMLNVLEDYHDRKAQLNITLWILTIPMMLIICFYTMMLSGLIVRNSRNEIAVIKSRGAGRLQVLMIYMAESLILAVVSFASGPGIGMFICRILGSSNGFLEFVNRKSLTPLVSPKTYGYSAAAAILFMLFMLVPVMKASTASIVEYKRRITRYSDKPFWQKFYLDLLVLAVCGYGYYNFQNRQDILGMTGLSGTELSVDPLLFFISTFFILGMSLLFLRLYPLLIRLVFRLGSRWWNPVLYFSLVNGSKADRNQQSIMLFIILALSFGIINANQARTINSNTFDKVMYHIGAEVVIEPYNNLKHQTGSPVMDSYGEVPETFSQPTQYLEPPYDTYRKIEGYESITRVLVDDKASVISGRDSIRDVRLLGVTPHEFGKTAWFRNDLLPYHLNEYLNMLSKSPMACFLSSNIKEQFNIREGDNLFIRLGGGDSLEFTVYGFLDYFPSCNPYKEMKLKATDETKVSNAYFAVINHVYVMKKLPAAPYEIWLKKKDGITDGTINDQLDALKLSVERVDYASQSIIQKKNDPMLLGTNGVLTMCFIVTMLITAVGFVLFWVLSIREKTLKFGIFRAMGMPMSSVTMIMLCEQFLVSVVAIVIGFVLGTVASTIFIPMLEMVYSAYHQIPPFKITADFNDYIKVLGIAGSMLFAGLVLLYTLVRSINVHQVIKMGEDS